MQKFGSKLLIVIVVIVIFCLANLVLITMKLPRTVGSLIHPDGHYLCVIFPYRNRLNDLQKNIPLINDFIGKQHVRHRLIVVNQTDNFRFNRAALLNIGSLEARKLGCDYIALHDIDIVPSNPKLNYSYPGKGRLMHITSGKYHPIVRYDYKNYIGGVLLITLDDFHKVNGMSNNFWGWGLEDDEFFLRLKEAELADKIERPANLDTNRSNTFLHLHTEKRDYKRNEYKRRRKRGRDRKSGLNNLQFTLKERRRVYIDRTVVTVLTIELFCAPENQSECI